jgi:signal transduction histidine kinase
MAGILSRARPRSLTARLLVWHAVAVIGGLLGLGALAQGVSAWTLVTTGLALGAVGGMLIVLVTRSSLIAPLSRMAASVNLMGRGDLATSVPEAGTQELASLARAIDLMRELVSSRIAELEGDRVARDAVLSSLQEGVLLLDADGSILYQNDRCTELLGAQASTGALTAQYVRDLVARETGEHGAPVDVPWGPPGRSLRATSTALPEGRVLLALRDVTDARRMDAVRRDFVANASHELKTPAASIRALAETLVEAAESDHAAVPRFAMQLELEAIRLSRVVSDLLDLSRLEVGTEEIGRVAFADLVSDEAERFRGRAEKASIMLTVAADGSLRVPGSDRDLRLLIRNLVENAIQYTRPGGTVDISVRSEVDDAVLAVRDTGVGIPSRDQGRIFERFYRVDRARSRETGGTGLGLSIVKHVVENHGGSVSVESTLGEGSTFTVRLPIGAKERR